MEVYTAKKQSQVVSKKVFSPGASLPSSQDPGFCTELNAEDCSSEQSSAVSLNKQLRENKRKLGNIDLEPLPAKSSDFPKSEDLELDKDYISRHVSPQIRSHQYITLYCSACGYRYTAPVKCDRWRLCSHCRKRESFRLRSKYLRMINSVSRERLRLVTVTIPNTEKMSRQTIQEIRSYWLKLLHQVRYEVVISGGVYSIEVINHGKGWNVHMHTLCEVKHKNMLLGSRKRQRATKAEKQLRQDWYKLTNQKAEIVSIRNANKPGGALGYILKDLLKSPGLTGLLARQYLEAVKSSRLISVFGKWYAKVKELVTARFKCPSCDNDSWLSEYFLRDIEQELYMASFGRSP